MLLLEDVIKMFPAVGDEALLPDDGIGELSVLNCAAGDITIKFDKKDKKDVEQARQIIKDLQGRGYLLFVQDGTELKKVTKFLPDTCEYVLQEPSEQPKSKRRRTGKRVPMTKVKATAIAPTAGG